MSHADIVLWPGRREENLVFQPCMEAFTLDDGVAHGAVIICPGGGYQRLALDREGAGIAERFNRLGFHCFVLHYRVAPCRHPDPLNDVARAVRLVRAGADSWNVRLDRIAVLGFSAGGHLAASLGVHYAELAEDVDLPGVSCRPDMLVLCYAVIHTHFGSFLNLLGAGTPSPLVESCKPHFKVDKSTVPAFIWHAADDREVPVSNALDFAAALSRHEVPFELHVFPRGGHGIDLAYDYPEAAVWPELCAAWLRRMD